MVVAVLFLIGLHICTCKQPLQIMLQPALVNDEVSTKISKEHAFCSSIFLQQTDYQYSLNEFILLPFYHRLFQHSTTIIFAPRTSHAKNRSSPQSPSQFRFHRLPSTSSHPPTPSFHTTTMKNKEGWDGKLRMEPKAVITNPEALEDSDYSDPEAPPVEEIDADEGTAAS